VAPVRRRVHLEQHQFPIDHLAGIEVLDLHDVDELVELLGHLLETDVVAAHHDRDARQRRVLGDAHRERVDVESASREERRHAREHARLVLHED
jgi:hypothetical protein